MQISFVNKIKVVIVDDCLLSRISLKRSLSLVDKLKITADFDNALEFLSYISNFRPDVVLMDLDLNGMNGIEATQIVKQKFPEIKVIVLTAHTGKDFFAASMFSGANAFVVKNVEACKLANIIEAVYFGAYWIDPVLKNDYKETFPKPNHCDLWHLYEKKKPVSFDLTVREMEVLRLVVQGKTNTEIAKEMIVSTNTAKAHVGNILNKMHVSDRVQAAVMAVKSNMI